ncbi:MAG: RNA polymerase sigma-70 factor [Acidobacteria bacterium]|nr:RNA polymerase sigma-70 factor [Acidobacteriota bacterium]
MIDWQSCDDSRLTAAVRDGDEAAFAVLYQRYAQALFSFLWRKSGRDDLAEELVQECFTKVWRNRSNLQPTQSVRGYLYQTARNLLIDFLRRKENENQSLDETGDLEGSASHEWQVIQNKDIQDALKQLPPMQFKVFVLSRFDGLSYQEIADYFEISIKTVEGHMSRALRKLRDSLAHLLILFLVWWMH